MMRHTINWQAYTYTGEYRIVVLFDVPHPIHVISYGYYVHQWYGMFSNKEDMMYLLLPPHVLFFS